MFDDTLSLFFFSLSFSSPFYFSFVVVFLGSERDDFYYLTYFRMRAHLAVGVWLAENFFSCGFLSVYFCLFFCCFFKISLYNVPNNILRANFNFFDLQKFAWSSSFLLKSSFWVSEQLLIFFSIFVVQWSILL